MIRNTTRRGFTLLEMLASIAVIAILAAILLPTLGAARSAALAARSRTQFAQWTAAVEQFRQEYGYYPDLAPDGRLATAADTSRFVRTLSGRNVDGTVVADAADLNGNTKRIGFYTFAAADFANAAASGDSLLCDAFGNTEIGFLVDRNGDGIVKPDDDGSPAAVTGALSGCIFAPSGYDLPASGVRAGILIYSAGRGQTQSDLILSWK